MQPDQVCQKTLKYQIYAMQILNILLVGCFACCCTEINWGERPGSRLFRGVRVGVLYSM